MQHRTHVGDMGEGSRFARLLQVDRVPLVLYATKVRHSDPSLLLEEQKRKQ